MENALLIKNNLWNNLEFCGPVVSLSWLELADNWLSSIRPDSIPNGFAHSSENITNENKKEKFKHMK